MRLAHLILNTPRLKFILLALVLGVVAPTANAQSLPDVNGLFYGDGDETRYTFLSTDITGSAHLYYALDPPTKTVYVAAVYVDGEDGDGLMEASDNVFAWGANNDYTSAVGWNHHNFDHVTGSDHAQIMIRCGATEYNFKIDLLYNNAMDDCDYSAGEWKADVDGPDGDGTNAPDGLKSESSIAWNMNNTTWDVDQGGCNPPHDWKSPDVDGDNSPLSDGYPYFNETIKWEWSTIYEISFDYSFCYNSGNALEVGIWDLHSSPWKPDWTPPASPLIAYSNIGVLPLDWGKIEARQKEGAIVVNWSTFNEHNVSHFEVERSLDGMNFEKIARVEFSDHRSLSKEWQYADSKPYSGINYYRIKHVDHDGYFSYSPIASAKYEPGNRSLSITAVYPNPANDLLKIRGLEAGRADQRILVRDQVGRTVVDRIASAAYLSGDHQINVAHLPPGLYFVHLEGSSAEPVRFVKN